MKIVKKLVCTSALSILVTLSSANATMNPIEAAFFMKINKLFPKNSAQAYKVTESIIPEYFEVDLTDGNTILAHESATNAILSRRGGKGIEVYDFSTNTSLTNERKAKNTLEYISKNDPLVSFKATNETNQIFVFGDIQCGYCQELHDSIPELNNAGVTVTYYPVTIFENSDLYMNAAYCSDNPELAYNILTKKLEQNRKSASEVTTKEGGDRNTFNKYVKEGLDQIRIDAESTIQKSGCTPYDMEAAQYNSSGMGISGTPVVVFGNGTSVVGKMTVKDIMIKLNSIESKNPSTLEN